VGCQVRVCWLNETAASLIIFGGAAVSLVSLQKNNQTNSKYEEDTVFYNACHNSGGDDMLHG